MSLLSAVLIFILNACFRPAPPLEQGDERGPSVSTHSETDGSITVEGHPIIKKRVVSRLSSAAPAQTTVAQSPTTATPTISTPITLPSSTTGGSTVSTPASAWVQEAYVKAANAGAGDYFGYSVALSGDTLAVGAQFEASNQTTITNGTAASSDNSASSAGAVYVYRRSGTTWAQEAYVKAANADSGDNFGNSVALSGETLAVGAYGEDSNQTTITNGTAASSNNSASSAGAVYVYRRSGTQWAQEAYVKAVNADVSDYFGWSVALSGETLVVGAFLEDSNQTTITNGAAASSDNSASSSGAVYVYRRSGTQWAQEAYVKAANADAVDYFGYSVALSGDALAVGAIYEDSNQNTISNGVGASSDNSASSAGAVYVYRRSGTTWAQEAYVKAANANASDSFGTSVALSGDTLAVGAYGEASNQTTITNSTGASNDNSASDSGAVYVYRRSGTQWAQEAYVKAANADASDYFGYSVALSGDTLAVGAFLEDSNQTTITNGTVASSDNSATYAGAVYVYRNTARLFDPDVRVLSTAQNSVTFAWGGNIGSSVQIKVASAAYGRQAPSEFCTDANSILLAPGATSYTYSGLSVGSKYGFRFCALDGNNASSGALVWAETDAQNFENGTDNWTLLGDQNPTTNRNQTYLSTPSDKMFGPFGSGESIAKQFQLNGEVVTISFDFLRLNSWDGEQFRIYVAQDSGAESLLISEAFAHTSSNYNYYGNYLGYSWWISTLPGNTFCFPTCSSWTSARHRVTIIAPASINTLKLRLTSTLDQGITDEAWGIDNFRLSP
ncbi:hypothetical protein EBU99_07605 [bacterium]|nr:hypothetical protein [bacterium]